MLNIPRLAWFKNRQAQAAKILSEVKHMSLSSDTDESEEEVKRKPIKRRKSAPPPIQAPEKPKGTFASIWPKLTHSF